MQAADFLSVLPLPGAQAQGQGRGLDAAAGMGGLFGSAEGGFGLEAETLDNAGFAEALMAVLAVAQPQQPQAAPTPPPKGEAADAVLDGASGRKFIPTLLTSAAPAAVTGQLTDAAALSPDGAPLVAPAPDAAGAAPATPSASAAPALVATEEAPAKTTAVVPETPLTSVPPAKPDAQPQAQAPASPLAKGFEARPGAAAAAPPAAPPPPAPVVLANGLTITALPDQPPQTAAAPVAPVETAAQQPPAGAPPPAQSQAAAVAAPKAPTHAKVQGPDAKPEPVAPEARAAAPAGVASAAKPEDTLTETAVAAAAPVEAEDAPVADKAPALPPVPAHAEAKGPAHAPALADAPKATPQTVAVLSAQIATSLEGGKSTRFEVQLEPMGLGKVDVRIEIRPSGDIKAELSFESPLAAAELRARSGELQTALERAGFDASKTQLSFNSGSQQGFGGQFADSFWRDQQQQQHQQNQSQSWRANAFLDLAETPQNPAAAYYARERADGVDVRI